MRTHTDTQTDRSYRHISDQHLGAVCNIHMLNGSEVFHFCNILPRGDSPEVNIGKMELEDTFNMCFVIPDCCRTRFSAVAMMQQCYTITDFSTALHMLTVVRYNNTEY